MHFGVFYLDKEKDIIVDLFLKDETMSYILHTPNHHTGNLITNLAGLCGLPVSQDDNGLLVIRGEVPAYIDGYNTRVYILRLGGVKVANIFEDGRIELKAHIPAISKTLMSQTKDYQLDIKRTIIKSYIRSEVKFRTDLHTHMNANLAPDLLIALGIRHQIRYPLYYIKKLDLRCSKRQQALLAKRREKAALQFAGSPLKGKYLDRKIDDNTWINFADLILHNLNHAAYNIPRIRASLAVIKDGQAVFTNLEKVYLYRYVFAKGVPSDRLLSWDGPRGLMHYVPKLPDADIRDALIRMHDDHTGELYRDNTLFQDKLLWIARSYARQGIRYAEISDTTLAKRGAAGEMLAQVHDVMPKVMRETGVMLRFLAGIRRTPLTIVKDRIAPDDYLRENLQVLRAVASDPYVAGSDILGEEMNDIRQIRPVIAQLTAIAREIPGFVIRIHAGENDSLRDNVSNSIACVADALSPGQPMPRMRVGHGLYTCNLQSAKGRMLLERIRNLKVVLEFQITSNVRLNNLSIVEQHPLKQYLKAGIGCVQGTDGGALYGTDSMDEQLTLERMLSLSRDELLSMHRIESLIEADGRADFEKKSEDMDAALSRSGSDVAAFYEERYRHVIDTRQTLLAVKDQIDAHQVLADKEQPIPEEMTPIVIAGGSFNSDSHKTVMRPAGQELIDRLMETGDPSRMCFVIGHRLSGYERWLIERSAGRFKIYAFVPSRLERSLAKKLLQTDVHIRVSIEPNGMGIYKSVSYEVFKRRPSVLIALDGNSAAANLIQEAKNAKKKCHIFVNAHSRFLKAKTQSLQGYVTLMDPARQTVKETAEQILSHI